MKKVASTDLGRFIVLAGKAITLTGEEKRTAEELKPLLDHLQAYHDGKPYPPPSAPTLSCCGYPHYDSQNRPNFGPNQVRYLCQLYPGLRVEEHNPNYGVIMKGKIVSYPYKRDNKFRSALVTSENDWWIKVCTNGRERELSLSDGGIVGGVPGTFYGLRWNTNWLEFQNQPKHCHRHHCHH